MKLMMVAGQGTEGSQRRDEASEGDQEGGRVLRIIQWMSVWKVDYLTRNAKIAIVRRTT